MRNPKPFSVIIISLIWRLSTRNYHMRNKTIDKTTKNNQTKAVKNEIVTNAVTRLMTLFFLETKCQLLLVEGDHCPELFYDLILIYRKTITVPCYSGTWVIYTYFEISFCCLGVMKINRTGRWP